MPRKRKLNFKSVLRHACTLCLVLAPVSSIHAASASDGDLGTSQKTEEIVVIGEKTLHALKEEVFRAQENFFEIFNALNLDDEFDVRCFYEVPTGTRIRQHVCRAKFVTDAVSEGAQIWMSNRPTVPAASVILQKKRHMRIRMELLIYDREELYAALNEYSYAREVFESERKKRCEDRLLVCGR